MEIMQCRPLVILDSAKDAQAMKRLKETIVNDLEYQGLLLVLGISSDKNARAMVDEIVPLSDSVVITAHKVMGRAANPDAIAKEIKRHSEDYVIVDDVKEAIKKALSLAKDRDLVLVTGSVFTVAEAREIWSGKKDGKWGMEFNEIPER